MRFRASRIILSAAPLAGALLLALPVQVRAEETNACFDANGSIEYKRQLVRVMVERCVRDALLDAQAGSIAARS